MENFWTQHILFFSVLISMFSLFMWRCCELLHLPQAIHGILILSFHFLAFLVAFFMKTCVKVYENLWVSRNLLGVDLDGLQELWEESLFGEENYMEIQRYLKKLLMKFEAVSKHSNPYWFRPFQTNFTLYQNPLQSAPT